MYCCVALGLALGAPGLAAGSASVVGEPSPDVLEEARSALSAARAAMALDTATNVPFTPSRHPGIRKRSVPPGAASVRVLVLPGLPVPLFIPGTPVALIGQERHLPGGGVALIPDSSTLPITTATRGAPGAAPLHHTDGIDQNPEAGKAGAHAAR